MVLTYVHKLFAISSCGRWGLISFHLRAGLDDLLVKNRKWKGKIVNFTEKSLVDASLTTLISAASLIRHIDITCLLIDGMGSACPLCSILFQRSEISVDLWEYIRRAHPEGHSTKHRPRVLLQTATWWQGQAAVISQWGDTATYLQCDLLDPRREKGISGRTGQIQIKCLM